MICCVRSAIFTALSLGSAIVSSIEFVCSDCVPPSTPASAFVRGAHDVVLGLLVPQRAAGGLGMEPHQPRFLALGAVALAHMPRPDAARGAQLGDLFEEVEVAVPEERQPRREVVDVETAREALLDVGEAVGQRESQLLPRRRARLADVVAGDRDRVPLRHVLGRELDQVDDDAKRRPRREAPALLRDVFLEDVVLQRAAELAERHALLLGVREVEREHDRRRPLIVIDVEITPGSMPSSRTSMSRRLSTATPHLPTSPCALGWSLS
jgi:hypothetical protein